MKMRSKLLGLIRIIRPELPASAGICIVVGQVIALGGLPSPLITGLGFALGFFLSSSAMIFNDYFDLEVDRVNAPQRPLPAGLLTPSEAAAAGAVTAVIALTIAVLLGPVEFALSLGLWILGFLYNWKLKSAGVWGNLIVSTNVGMTLILGGISVGQVGSPLVWILGLVAFCFDLAEEIAGDAMDMDGDQKRASKSLALVHGKTAALRVSAAPFTLVIALTLAPVLIGETGPGYILPMVMMDGLIVVFTARLLKSRTPQEGRKAMRVLYLGATLGLVALMVGRLLG